MDPNLFRNYGLPSPSSPVPGSLLEQILVQIRGLRPAASPYLAPQTDQGSYAGVYEPWLDFQERWRDALELGIAPPASPSPEDMQDYLRRAWPHLEQQLLDRQAEVGSHWHPGRWNDLWPQDI
jgi:hypothetical protein